ncbi:MAG: cytosine/creatinine deaminase [Actinomycetota bacterium]|nr:cytosine/creatinine deaminase [Actinomycetota bacterium]
MTRQAIIDATLPDGSRADVVIDGERVVEVGPGVGAAVEARVEAAGGLLLPAYIDTHIHLDKVLIRDQLVEHDGTLRGAIEAIHAAKRAYTVDDVRRRAAEVIRCSVLTGTTRLRSHVDVDTVGGLVPIEGVLAAARDCAGIAEVRTIAFPQEGILRDPGTAELMVAAMEAGADVVGGMPHWEQGEDDQREHVRWCFELARRFDADVDMHVDETDDGSVRTLAMVVDETERTGWQGRVTVGHVCALSAADDDYAARVIAGCAGAGIVVVSNPVTNLVLQGRGDHGLVRRGTTRVRELLAAGVGVAFGQDCVQDGFYPFGRGDLLEVALVSAHAAQLTTGAELRQALAAVTTVPATAWRLGDSYGVSAGARADLQLYAAAGWPEVLRLQDPPRAVWFRGRTVARTTVQRELLG